MPVARVGLSATGRPQTVWCLTALGARRAGLYFAPPVSSDALLKGLLKAEFVLTYPEGYYPLFFADQVGLFERYGARFPWPPGGPSRTCLLLSEGENTIHVALILTVAREAGRLLKEAERRLSFLNHPPYRLTLVIPAGFGSIIEILTSPLVTTTDPYCRRQRTYREWKARLHGLSPAEERYRRYIEALLARIEEEGKQDSAERYDLVVRAYPATRFTPDVMTVPVHGFKRLEV
jgi:hypothetical protein